MQNISWSNVFGKFFLIVGPLISIAIFRRYPAIPSSTQIYKYQVHYPKLDLPQIPILTSCTDMLKKHIMQHAEIEVEFSSIMIFHSNSQWVFRALKQQNVFHIYLMRRFQKYGRNWIFTMSTMCCQMGWIGCSRLQVAKKAIVRIQFLAYFWNLLIK